MKEYYSKISKDVKVIILSENEELPIGYVPVAGVFISGKEIQAAIPNRLAQDDFKLASFWCKRRTVAL
jgi:hypothetical protein